MGWYEETELRYKKQRNCSSHQQSSGRRGLWLTGFCTYCFFCTDPIPYRINMFLSMGGGVMIKWNTGSEVLFQDWPDGTEVQTKSDEWMGSEEEAYTCTWLEFSSQPKQQSGVAFRKWFNFRFYGVTFGLWPSLHTFCVSVVRKIPVSKRAQVHKNYVVSRRWSFVWWKEGKGGGRGDDGPIFGGSLNVGYWKKKSRI